jgi:hypothetical protein
VSKPILPRLETKRENIPALCVSTPITKPLIANTRGNPNVVYIPNLGIRLKNAGRILPIRARGELPSIKKIRHPPQKKKSGLEWQKRMTMILKVI